MAGDVGFRENDGWVAEGGGVDIKAAGTVAAANVLPKFNFPELDQRKVPLVLLIVLETDLNTVHQIVPSTLVCVIASIDGL